MVGTEGAQGWESLQEADLSECLEDSQPRTRGVGGAEETRSLGLQVAGCRQTQEEASVQWAVRQSRNV